MKTDPSGYFKSLGIRIKGEGPGHEFRGNQYTDEGGGADKYGLTPKARAEEVFGGLRGVKPTPEGGYRWSGVLRVDATSNEKNDALEERLNSIEDRVKDSADWKQTAAQQTIGGGSFDKYTNTRTGDTLTVSATRRFSRIELEVLYKPGKGK